MPRRWQRKLPLQFRSSLADEDLRSQFSFLYQMSKQVFLFLGLLDHPFKNPSIASVHMLHRSPCAKSVEGTEEYKRW